MEELGKEEQGRNQYEPVKCGQPYAWSPLLSIGGQFTSLSHIVPLTMVHLSSLGSHRSLILSERNQTKQRRSEGEWTEDERWGTDGRELNHVPKSWFPRYNWLIIGPWVRFEPVQSWSNRQSRHSGPWTIRTTNHEAHGSSLHLTGHLPLGY